MKIVYDDIIYSLQKSGGVSVYWTELIKNIDNPMKHIVYDNADNNYLYKQFNWKDIKLKSSTFMFLKRYFNVKLKEKQDYIFHSSYYRFSKDKKAINVTTVHDFTYEYYRKDLKSMLHKIQKKNAVMHSEAVICVSENTKKDLIKTYPNYSGRVEVIYNGYDDLKFKFFNEKREKRILYVGSRNSYKNFGIAVEIMSRLPEYNFTIVGGGELSKEEKNLLKKIDGQYTILGYVDENKLVELYNKSMLLLYPSDYEGFGIPLVEAQACGCPVACQKISAMSEVVLDTALSIDVSSTDLTVKEIMKLQNREFFLDIQKKGIENAKRFSWKQCSERVYELYKELLEKKEI